MTHNELQEIKESLLNCRSLLIRQISETKKSLREHATRKLGDSGDQIWKFNTSNLWLSQTRLRSRRLELVEDALDRLACGTFGFCQDCGKTIEEKRLKALPWTQLCFKCQQKNEILESSVLERLYLRANRLLVA